MQMIYNFCDINLQKKRLKKLHCFGKRSKYSTPGGPFASVYQDSTPVLVIFYGFSPAKLNVKLQRHSLCRLLSLENQSLMIAIFSTDLCNVLKKTLE